MSSDLTLAEMATNYETSKHIRLVSMCLHKVAIELLRRADAHDQSKLKPPEVALFTEWTPFLAASTYGSPEYERYREKLGPALAHHYAKNRHHPEHHKPGRPDPELAAELEALRAARGLPEEVKARLIARLEGLAAQAVSGVNGMDVVDLVEMLCDWKAATLRHHDGNLRRSIEVNARRFGLAGMLTALLENSVPLFDAVQADS